MTEGIMKWLAGDRSATWMGFLTRHVLEDAPSFNEAKKWLSQTKMLAPAYFILGGNNSADVSSCLFLGKTQLRGVLPYSRRVRRPASSLSFIQSEAVVYLENGLT